MNMSKLLEMQKELMNKVPHDVTVLAYFAGIFYAEGNKRGTGAIRIGNTSRALIEWLSDTFGGSVCLQKPGPLTKKQYYLWSLGKRESTELMNSLPNPDSLDGSTCHSYMAGLIDGDGTIYTKKVNKRGKLSLYPAVVFASINLGPVKFIHDKYGGSLSEQQPRPGHREKKPYWYLMVTGRRAEILINDILPYLLIKCWVAKTVMEECSANQRAA